MIKTVTVAAMCDGGRRPELVSKARNFRQSSEIATDIMGVSAESGLVDSTVKGILNVPLGDFDDLRVIFGEDQATGSYGKSFADIPSESINVDDTSETQGMSAELQSNSRRAKRSRHWEEAFGIIDGLADHVARLMEVVVISDQHADQKFYDKVYGELLVFEDEAFDDDFLTKPSSN